MSSSRLSAMSLVPSCITPEERHRIIVEYLERINKPTKVFHLRWKPGELLTGEVLESTPMFWYMKYQWSRQEIEEMFYAARCVIGAVFGQSLQQTYGGTAGPRWRGTTPRGTVSEIGSMDIHRKGTDSETMANLNLICGASSSPPLLESQSCRFEMVKTEVISMNEATSPRIIPSESQRQLVESQEFLIEALREQNDKLSQRINQRQVDHQKILQNTINIKEIEMSDLRIEIEKLQEDNKRIGELQSINVDLKQKLSLFDRIINSKRTKALPSSPGSGGNVRSPRPRGHTVDGTGCGIPRSPSASGSGTVTSNSLTPSFSSNITPSVSPSLSSLSVARKSGRRTSILSLCSSESAEVDDQKEAAKALDCGKMEKFKRYQRMKKIGTPFMAIIHKMRMDGMSQDDIDEFSGKSKVTSTETEQESMAELATEMGFIPKREVAPQRVQRLKRIHWKTIELKEIKGTVWERMAKQYDDADIGVDAKFELQFQVRSRKPPKYAARRKLIHGANGHGKPSGTKRAKIKWLSAKRDQMIQIGLRKVGLKYAQIHDGIAGMDEKMLTVNVLETLLDLLPSPEEQSKTLKKMDEIEKEDVLNEGLIETCGPSEMFFVEMSAIPEVKSQVTQWLFCRTFREIYTHRMQQTTTMLRAAKKIKLSKALHEYLRIMLAVGNLMNHGTEKSRAYGFNLDCLEMLEAIKDFSGKKTLAMFIYEFGYNKFPATRKLNSELEILKTAVRFETNIIELSVKQMSDEFDAIDIMCRRLADDYEESETVQYREYMQSFLVDERAKMAVLKTKLKNAKSISRAVCKYYGYFDLAEQDKPETLFKIIQGFVDIMEKAKRSLFDLEKERIKLRQKRERERVKLRKKRLKENVQNMRSLAQSFNATRKTAAAQRQHRQRLILQGMDEHHVRDDGDDGINQSPSRNHSGDGHDDEGENDNPCTHRVVPPPSMVTMVTMAMDAEDGSDTFESEETPLTQHFRKQTEKFKSQTLDIADRLSTTFHEKQAIAKGQMTESLKQNHIKQKSIMSNGSFHCKTTKKGLKGSGKAGGISVMDQIAKMVSRELLVRDSEEEDNENENEEEEEEVMNDRDRDRDGDHGAERRKSKRHKKKRKKEKERERKKKRRSSKRERNKERDRINGGFMPPILNM